MRSERRCPVCLDRPLAHRSNTLCGLCARSLSNAGDRIADVIQWTARRVRRADTRRARKPSDIDRLRAGNEKLRRERDEAREALRTLLAGVDGALPGSFTVTGADEARAVLAGTPATDLRAKASRENDLKAALVALYDAVCNLEYADDREALAPAMKRAEELMERSDAVLSLSDVPDEFHCHGCDAWPPAAELVRCPRCERECCAACVRDHRGNVMTAEGMRRCVEVSDAG